MYLETWKHMFLRRSLAHISYFFFFLSVHLGVLPPPHTKKLATLVGARHTIKRAGWLISFWPLDLNVTYRYCGYLISNAFLCMSMAGFGWQGKYKGGGGGGGVESSRAFPMQSSQASSKHPLKIEIVKTSVASCHEFFLTHLNEIWSIKLYNTISLSFVRCLDCLHNPHLLDSFRPVPVQRGFDQCPRRPLVRSVRHLAGLLQLSLWSTYLRLFEQARQGQNGSSLQEILQINFDKACGAQYTIKVTEL